ncbi:MAG: phosphate/phosphite/phosphonate ABC transporter substrate-binding protein [Azoarcus sp.]|jgi:phosphonate transport system substrate-binding protein|nr:phosphate/phosphite/phosphonate ABC transporter substrate-binding protein [Azoarcus sp.]
MDSIKCGLLPGESPPVVRRLNEPLRAWLERRLRMPVELVIGRNYVATGEALRRGALDFAYLGPVTYILQSRAAPLEAFARPTHGGSTGPTFKAAVIVPRESRARTLADLAGGEIALGDLASTSGSWVPRHMLLAAGLMPDKDYTRRHVGAHDAVVDAVARCQSAAGGVSLTVFRRLLAEGFPAVGAVRVLAESPPIPEYMWTFRAGLPAALRDEIRAAFHSLAEPEPLAAFAATAFIPAVDPDVDRVRHWMEELLEARLFSGNAPAASPPEPARAVA